MSKETEVKLDELNCLYGLLDRANHDEYLSRIGIEEATKFLNENQKYAIILRQVLQRLEAINRSNPSEAMEELDSGFEVKTKEYGNMIAYGEEQVDIIKQALIKAQEDKKKVEALKELFANHIEFVVEKDRCYFKIKNSKGKEKSFTSYTMLDFWKEVLE